MKFLLKLLREIIAVAQRILLELVRRRRSLIFWAVFPAVVLILNALILQERAKLSLADAFERAAPVSLVGAALFFSCLGGSVATVVAEREAGTLKRLFISPLSGLSYFLGIWLAHSAIALGQTALVYAIAFSQGSSYGGDFALGSGILALVVAGYVGTGFILGTQFARRTEDVNALVAAFGVPLLILGGTFLPTSLFPKSLLDLAQYNPIYHMNEAFAKVAIDGKTANDISTHLQFLGIFAAVSVLLGWLSYRRMVQVERQL